MKKLLLILAAIAYIAFSCEDKPTTLTGGDEPETEQPGGNPADSSSNPSEPEDLGADTCNIFIGDLSGRFASCIYNISSDEIDFQASINSMFKHLTITLKDGTTPQWIGTSCSGFSEGCTTDTGYFMATTQSYSIDSLKHGTYCLIAWFFMYNSWGPNCYIPEQKFIYHDIVLDANHTSDTTLLDINLWAIYDSLEPLVFRKF